MTRNVIWLTVSILAVLNSAYYLTVAVAMKSQTSKASEYALAEQSTSATDNLDKDTEHYRQYYFDSIYNINIVEIGATKLTFSDCRSKLEMIGFDVKGTLKIKLQIPKQEVTKPNYDADAAQLLKVIKGRLDISGASINKLDYDNRNHTITIELKGIDNPARISRLLSKKAHLEFYDTYENEEVIGFLDSINAILRNTKTVTKRNTPADDPTLSILLGDSAPLVPSNPIEIDRTNTEPEPIALPQPFFEVVYPSVYMEGNNMRIAEGPVVGRVLIKDTAKVNSILAMNEVQSILPIDLKLLWSIEPNVSSKGVFLLYAIKLNTSLKATLDGDVITEAYINTDELGLPCVNLEMSKEGAKAWEQITDNAFNGVVNGKPFKKCIAIVMDERVFSAPRVQSKITGGRSVITGIGTETEAADLANVLQSGKLPLSVDIIEEEFTAMSAEKEAQILSFLIIAFLLALLASVFFTVLNGYKLVKLLRA